MTKAGPPSLISHCFIMSQCYKIQHLRGRHAEDDLFTHYIQIVQKNLICRPDDKKKAN